MISGSNALRYSAAQKTFGRLDVFLMCAFLRLALECFSCNLSLNNIARKARFVVRILRNNASAQLSAQLD